MEVIAESFLRPPRGYKNHTQDEIKKMSMLRRKVWMTDDDEFDYIVKNSQRVLGLSIQYENHQYIEEFTKQYNVMFIYGTYALEGEADSKFSLGDIWNLFQEPNNPSNFCRQMMTCMKAWNYLNTGIIRQTHKIMMDGEDILVGEYRKLPAFAGYHIFAPASLIASYMEGTIFRFHETKKDYPIIATTNLFEHIINIHSFEDGNGRICRLILAHVLIQIKCCLLPVILSSFHRRVEDIT